MDDTKIKGCNFIYQEALSAKCRFLHLQALWKSGRDWNRRRKIFGNGVPGPGCGM
jgi:hypothetical protein